jgi:hypothetical protein
MLPTGSGQGIEGFPGVAAPVFHEEKLYEVESAECSQPHLPGS